MTVALLGGLLAAVGAVGSRSLESGLTDAAIAALRDAGVSGVSVRFEGREAFLSASGATQAQLAHAERVVEDVKGVRWATVVDSDPATQPSLTVINEPDGGYSLVGAVGSVSQASDLEAAAIASFGDGTAVDITVDQELASAPWTAGAAELFAALDGIDAVSFAVEASGATLTGAATDPAFAVAAVREALGGIPLDATVGQAGPSGEEIEAINGTVILFAPDSARLDATARAQISTIAAILRQYPSVEVTVAGHIAIVVGSEAEAVAFSARRAEAVAAALVADGVEESRLDVVGAGSSDPVGNNSTGEGAAANRRVVVRIEEGT